MQRNSRIVLLGLVAALSLANLSFTYGKTYLATAYCLKGRTASGQKVRRGIVAVDTRLHKLGSKITIQAGSYSGTYLAADTGRKIKGKRLDIWVASKKEAIKFGKRKVLVH